jgi:hypothetical protein
MACIAPPPPQVSAIIQVGAGPTYPLTYLPADAASANYIDSSGDLDFSCFNTPITVQFTIQTAGVFFYQGYGKDSLSFADHAGQPKQPLAPGHHQFPGWLHHSGTQVLKFTYKNDSNCGVVHGPNSCVQSSYGVYLGNSSGFLTRSDPIINNGGNPN